MKKIYLLLMLFLGCVGSASAQFSTTYNFRNVDGWGEFQLLNGDDETFTVNIPARDYDEWYEGGFDQGWGENALTTKIANLNFSDKGNVKAFAFNAIKVNNDFNGTTSEHNAWLIGWKNNGRVIENHCDKANVFTIPNLRAGEKVKVKTYDENGGNFNVRFIVNHSPNAVDNLPWSKVNGIPGAEAMSWIKEWEQQFVMLEDGDLDLKLAGWASIEEITIESNYTNFEQRRAQVGTPISLQLQCGKFQTGNGTYRFNMIEPVVLYRGDLTPGTVTVSKTNDSEQTGNTGTFSITISGFSGKQYENGYWEGGSIIVMLDNTMVTYTVPYEVAKQAGNAQPNSASWNFWQRELQVGRSTDPAYKSLLAHDIAEGAFQHGNTVFPTSGGSPSQPLSLYKGTMNGQNAYYNAETAGLIFEGNANIYGLLNETTDPVSNGDRWIALRKGGKMIIPGLKKGDQVWMYVDHYGDAYTPQGKYKSTTLSWYVTNALDALGNTIDPSKPVVTGAATWGPVATAGWAKQYYGAMHYFAASDGDMTFTVDGNQNSCYAKICYIKILKKDEASTEGNPNNVGNIEPTNQILGLNGDNHGYEFLTTEDPDGTRHATSGSLTLHDSGRGSLIQKWQVLETSGNLNKGTLNYYVNNPITDVLGPYDSGLSTNPIKFKYTSPTNEPCFGSFLLRGMDYDHDGKYCLDYADRVIAVGFLQTMKFPYTWDLTDILNTQTGNSGASFNTAMTRNDCDTTKVWIDMGDGKISLQNNMYDKVNNRILSSGTQLFGNTDFIEEAAGLGWATINMDKAFNGSIQVTDQGVKIQTYNGWDHRLYIPGINKDGWLFVRGKKLNDGKGFIAKAFLDAEMGPNTMKKYAVDPRVDLTRIETSDATEIVEQLHYAATFDQYFEEASSVSETKQYDEYMTVTATAENPVEEKLLGSGRLIDNSTGLYTVDDIEYETDRREDGQGGYVDWVITDNHVYLNDDNSTLDNAIYDKNVVLNNDLADESFVNFIDLKGKGNSSYRTIQLTNLPANCSLTVVARANQPRQLNIFAGAWGTDTLATMIVRDALMAKTIEDTGNASTITIGSKNSGVEIFGIYITQEGQQGSGSETYIGYVPVSASDGGVTLYLNDIIIEKIGYSVEKKNLNIIGWASESRNYYIDHSLDAYFNGKTVDAYMVTSANQEQIIWSGGTQQNVITSVSLTKIDKPMEFSAADGDPSAAKKTGCIIYCSDWDPDTDTGINLFVPDIHDYLLDSKINQSFIGNTSTYDYNNYGNADQDKIIDVQTAGNMMVAKLYKGNVPKSTINDTYTNYVMAYKYTDGDGVSHPTANEEPVERIVRSNNASLKANSAYIQFLTANVKPSWWTGDNTIAIVFDNEEGNADGIETISLNGSDSVNDVYYNLNGQRIDKPTTPGVYVKNGKKVYVK